jgi:hypothetical protein
MLSGKQKGKRCWLVFTGGIRCKMNTGRFAASRCGVAVYVGASEWSTSRPDRFSPWYSLIRVWIHSKAGMDVLEKKHLRVPAENRTPDCQVQNLVMTNLSPCICLCARVCVWKRYNTEQCHRPLQHVVCDHVASILTQHKRACNVVTLCANRGSVKRLCPSTLLPVHIPEEETIMGLLNAWHRSPCLALTQ